MKPDPRRLQLTFYPFVAEIPPRFGDMDILRHLNNVALAAVYEEGRIALHRDMRLDEAREKGSRTVIGEVRIRYIEQAHYPDMLQVAGAVSRIGGASYSLAQGLFQNGRCVGVADTVIVNTRDGRSHPLPEVFRTALRTRLVSDGDDNGAS